MSAQSITALEETAVACRLSVLRMLRASGCGHMGGAMSCLDILTVLYFRTMRCDPSRPGWPQRDRFVLSAGHKCMALYAVLAEKGYFDKDVLDTYGSLGARIPGHPDMHKLPGVEANTGALGHGLSLSVGMALGLRSQQPGVRVFTVMGDGELPEGSNWEAAAAATHHRVDNLVVFVDANGLQIGGATSAVMNMEPIAGRFAAFGWETREIDGNDMGQVVACLDALPIGCGAPVVVVARTVKGKGIGFTEGTVASHYWKPSPEKLERAELELAGKMARRAVQ